MKRMPAVRTTGWGWAALVLAFAVPLLMWAPDRVLSGWMRSLPADVIAFFRVVTIAGESQWYLVPSGLALPLLWWLRYRTSPEQTRIRQFLLWAMAVAGLVFFTIALSGIAANIIKFLVGRARPRLLLEGIYGFSPVNLAGVYHAFPSGHATTIFALAVVLSHFWPRIRGVWYTAALFVAASRVIINAHFLSDVLTGAFLGASIAIALCHIFTRRWPAAMICTESAENAIPK